MTTKTLLIVLLILFAVGAFPAYNANPRYGGALGLAALVVLLLLVFGVL